MKYRKNPKIYLKKPIYAPDNPKLEIGLFMLVGYLTQGASPHIEFLIEDEFAEYRNKGILSQALPKYLKLCKKWGHNKLIAIVKNNNKPSLKLLEKNDFIKVNSFGENVCYVIDLEQTKEKLKMMQKLIFDKFN